MQILKTYIRYSLCFAMSLYNILCVKNVLFSSVTACTEGELSTLWYYNMFMVLLKNTYKFGENSEESQFAGYVKEKVKVL